MRPSALPRLLPIALVLCIASWCHAAAAPAAPTAERALLLRELDRLRLRLDRLATGSSTAASEPDAEAFYKAALWALRFEPDLSAEDLAQVRNAIARSDERTAAMERGAPAWPNVRGRLIRGYRSAVDGSVQPYGLILPAGYDSHRPIRLDVVLHGSSRPTGMSELQFIRGFDASDDSRGAGSAAPYIELHPLGRVENCYRWAGETDVFEAIEDVCRKYSIDRDRIVLRGMSMGASGTWHLGLKHPDTFVALGPYCGYVDTHHFSETPGMNFVRVGPLPEVQEKVLHMLDSIDYAANAGVVPVVACIGDRDPFFQAHVLMGQAMAREGLQLVNLISHGTGHVIDPVVQAEELRRIKVFADRGLDHAPQHIRFVTWTLKYSRCHWLQALSLGEHYVRAELEATAQPGGVVALLEPRNVTRLAILPPMLQSAGRRLRIGSQDVPLPAWREGEAPRPVVIERRAGTWRYAGSDTAHGEGERPGLQGPIDDAFTRRFLCVRGTGKPWNPAVQTWADASLRRFADEWARYFRGDLPVKDDTAVTAEDLRSANLILFGDPGSNVWIRRALPRLPVRWSHTELRVGTARYPAADHAPALICPNPLPGGAGHYLVLNSGHTFHAPELSTLNYLLFPRLGDLAVFRVGTRQPAAPTEPLDEHVIRAEFLDERWRVAARAGTQP